MGRIILFSKHKQPRRKILTFDRREIEWPPRRRWWRVSRRQRQVLTLAALWSGLFLGAAYISQTDSQKLASSLSNDDRTIWRTGIGMCWGGFRYTCLVDGDTGWESGRKWRLMSVDAPELSGAKCAWERSAAQAARDRPAELMSTGYRIRWSGETDRYGRDLVDIVLSDGSDVAEMLISEGLARRWTGRRYSWC